MERKNTQKMKNTKFTTGVIGLFFVILLLIFGCKDEKKNSLIKQEQPVKSVEELTISDAISAIEETALKAGQARGAVDQVIASPDGTLEDLQTMETYMQEAWSDMSAIEAGIKELKGILPIDSPQEPVLVGFGKNTTGGEGFNSVYVTNTNDSGAGSLRSALMSGNKNIIYSTSGPFNLNDKIDLEHDNITIDGSNSPLGYIVINAYGFQIEASNIFLNNVYINFENNPNEQDPIRIRAYSGNHIENIYIRNVTLLRGTDQNLSISTVGSGTVKNVTIEQSLFGYCVKNFLIMGNVSDVTIYQNAMISNAERHIRASTGQTDKLAYEMINNALVDFIYGNQNNLGTKFSSINNHFITTRAGTTKAIEGVSNSDNSLDYKTYAYISGNIYEGIGGYGSKIAPYLRSSPFNSSGVVPKPANELRSILQNVGAGHPDDAELIAKY